MIDRCRTKNGHFIPGCMGAAAIGRHACTCPQRRERYLDNDFSENDAKKMAKKIADLEKRIKKLEGGRK